MIKMIKGRGLVRWGKFSLYYYKGMWLLGFNKVGNLYSIDIGPFTIGWY